MENANIKGTGITVAHIIEELDCTLIAGKNGIDRSVESGFVGDLLSIVMGKAKADSVWITIQSHINIIAVASLVDVSCVIVTEGYDVDQLAINRANEEDIAILSTKLSSYEITTKLYELGIK
ncbi:MAG: DRTGG domain-containing protein [Vallitaleaceae bacterium]|jgi:predicted transcriptional regulator|nr:DRTGG domain-containing protein [Vallitaleaceae bacterium]